MLQPVLNGKGHHAGTLPKATPDRDYFIGVAIIPTTGNSHSLRLSVSKVLLDKIGKPKRVAIRGTPENGYIISNGKEVTPSPTGADGKRFYIYIAASKASAPQDERKPVWVRSEIEGDRLRIPPLPPAWVGGDAEFLPGTLVEETDRDMKLSRTAGDDAVRVGSTSAPISPTVPPAKTATPDYKLPDNIGIADAQALLGRKLDEARAIMRELEQRTGLRMTLTRNFQITLDLSSK